MEFYSKIKSFEFVDCVIKFIYVYGFLIKSKIYSSILTVNIHDFIINLTIICF